MKPHMRNFTFLTCCIFLGSILLIIQSADGAAFSYKKCRGRFIPTVTIWLLKGRCSKNCEILQNCTTFFGNIIVRSAILGKNDSLAPNTKNNDASFPALREITGYLIVVFAEQHPGMTLLFPNLAVIRGMELFLHYALVFYRTELEKVNLPALTVIKSGGVRIDHNEKMCYVDTIRWRSIVAEKTQTIDNFGIVFNKNNKNCYDKCYSRKCFAPSGHGSARLQYCWGPGDKKTGNMECQRFCKATCGSQGCVLGTTDKCCSSQCLGGCTKPNSNFHCVACKNYRTGKYGKCVEKCPNGMYVSENFECRDACLYWQYWHFNFGLKYYVHNGHCVAKCPAGYLENKSTRTCDKCLTRRCPRVCPMSIPGFGRTIRIEGLSDAQKYKGCTEINANISVEIRAGPADTVQKLKEYLGSIETVNGFVEIRESQALGTLGFFENLVQINPKYLYQNEFALAVFRNMNLKSLWKPKSPLTVSKGQLFFHTNPQLCPKVIKTFQSSIGKNRTDAISENMNGYLAYCNVKKLNITVYEVTDKRLCAIQKCLNVTWYHERYIDSRNLFYSVNYRKVSNKAKAFVQGDDVCGNVKWSTEEVSVPLIKLGNNSKAEVEKIQMHALLQNLSAFAIYEVFVETYVLNGEGRLSDFKRIQLSESISRRPLALEASFLSPSQIQLKWNPPDQPNGIITEYKIYFKKNYYSVWRKNLDWCQRDVTQVDDVVVDASEKNNTTLANGFCPKNRTCDCEKKVEESRKLVQDRDSVLFQKAFEDKIFMSVFSKPRDKDEDNDSKQDKSQDSVQSSSTPATYCSGNSSTASTCKPSTTNNQGGNTKITTQPASTAMTKLNTTNITTFSGPSKMITKTPTDETVVVVNGKTFKVVLKNLQYFQEYKIRVCPCNRAGCGTSLNCAVVFGRTDVNASADNIPEPVRLILKEDSYNVTWQAPPNPNGIILRYDIGIRHNNNREIVRCQLATLPRTLRDQGVASGNYTIRIRAIAPASNGSWTMPVSFKIEEKHFDSPVTNKIVIGIGTAAALVILLLVVIVIYYAYVKKTAQMGVPGILYASVNPEYLNSNEVYIPDEWEVPREKIELIRELGKGSFGMVYEGIAYGIIEEEPKLKVAVKTVNENASIRDRIEFLQEASIMKAFNCNHIVRLLGVVSQGQPTLVVMELMERGDLKTYLRSRRPEERGGLMPPNLAEILQMAAEIADGMSYLAARKFVHRDLAARNCMVAADFTVKIGDFGMTRDIYETDYYRKGGKGLLPVRWMAPESLKDGIFTTASDVWSYGVVLWEMATLAAQPYPGKSNEDVLRFVIEGGVLEQPDDCSDRLYNMMCNCWKTDPRARPSFLEIVQFLENDVSDTFEEVSYYHEMKRKLLEATETTLLKGSEQVNQVRHGSLKVTPNMMDADVAGSVSSESAAEENWKTEADRGLRNPGASCNVRSQSMYDNDGDAVNMRYVEMPNNNGKSKKNVKPVPV